MIRELWARVITPICGDVTTAATVREAMAMIPDADVMILDWQLTDGNAAPVLDLWAAENGGPMCVLTGALSRDDRLMLYSKGVQNALEKPIPIETLTSIIRHYVRDVENIRGVEDLAIEVRRLRRVMMGLALAFVAVTGPNAIKIVEGLLF